MFGDVWQSEEADAHDIAWTSLDSFQQLSEVATGGEMSEHFTGYYQ